MKIASYLFWIPLTLAAWGCTSVQNLPELTYIGKYERGSHIEVWREKTQVVAGELIAVGNDNVTVLRKDNSETVTIKQAEITRFVLRFARPRNYAWTIPSGVVLSTLHGYFGVFTFPLNLLVTIPITMAGFNSYTYTKSTMSYDELRMFARFPQGIPPGLEVGAIH